jgi:hypothetical protein
VSERVNKYIEYCKKELQNIDFSLFSLSLLLAASAFEMLHCLNYPELAKELQELALSSANGLGRLP